MVVSVHNEEGGLVGGVLSGGNGMAPAPQYKATLYYHQERPRWAEHFKVSLPMNIEDFSNAHLKFTFRHR